MISIEILGEIVHVRFSISIDSCFSQYSLISWANFAHIRGCVLPFLTKSLPFPHYKYSPLARTSTLLNFMPPHFFFSRCFIPFVNKKFHYVRLHHPLCWGILFHHRYTSSTTTSNPLLGPLL